MQHYLWDLKNIWQKEMLSFLLQNFQVWFKNIQKVKIILLIMLLNTTRQKDRVLINSGRCEFTKNSWSAFILLNRQFQHGITYICSSIVKFVRNCYSTLSRLFVARGTEISKEETTQARWSSCKGNLWHRNNNSNCYVNSYIN